jgi:hypothetical protein
MIEIYGVVAIILLIVVSYVGGLFTANWYNDKARRDEKHALEVQYIRLQAKTDYNDPVGPYVASDYCRAGGPPTIRNMQRSSSGASNGIPLSQMHSFEERIKNTGKATMWLKPGNPTTITKSTEEKEK